MLVWIVILIFYEAVGPDVAEVISEMPKQLPMARGQVPHAGDLLHVLGPFLH